MAQYLAKLKLNSNQLVKGITMNKRVQKQKLGDSLFDDTFSYLNLAAAENETAIENEERINQLLEDYHIEDLDLSEFNKDEFDESWLV